MMQSNGEKGYLDLLDYILRCGTDKTDRTGVGTRSIFGAQLRFNLQNGFPLLTTKRVFTRGVFGELVWLMSGDTNIRWLQERGIHIWDDWADGNGDLGPVYGAQWRRWIGPETTVGHEVIDQLQNAVDLIKDQPDSRRIIVNAWNPGELADMALTPCHAMFQFEVHDGKLSLSMYQRSADMFLGVPFNIASYAALTHVIADVTDLEVGDLIISYGDAHIYRNHFEQVREQLSRTPKRLPSLELVRKLTSIDDVHIADFKVVDYDPHPTIKAPVAV